MVPALLVLLAKSAIVDQFDLSCLKVIVCSSAPLSADTEAAVYRRIGKKKIRQVYGLTEASICLMQTEKNNKAGSVGTVPPGVYGKIIDPDTGKLCGPYERGEMLFKSNSLMRGYVNNPQATRDVIDADGWFHTGDIGYYDKDGEWFIVDRLKELIKYKGYQVAPAELEALILTHPYVQDVGVIGVPDERSGEVPLAFVVRKVDVSEKDIIDFVAERVSVAKRLHGGVQFMEQIPRNSTGKVLRKVLREKVKLSSKL